MKTGIRFWPHGGCRGYGRFGEDKYLKVREHGFDTVDFTMMNTEAAPYSLSSDEFASFLKREREQAERAGVEIFQVHGPWRYPPQDGSAEERAERMEKCKKSIYATHLLGCKYWVIHPLMPYGFDDIPVKKESATYDTNLAFWRELVPFAKQYGVTVCIENMPAPGFSLGAPEKLLSLVKEIDDDNFKICLDTGHVAVFPSLSVGESARLLGSHIKVLHVHDNMGDRDSHLPPGEGIIDWRDFSAALREIGFEGSVSLELLPPEQPEDEFEAKCIALSKTAREIAEGEFK